MDFETDKMDVLNRAEGYCSLHLYKDAWDTTERLHKLVKANPEIAELRLRIAVGLKRWDLGEEAADQVSEGNRIDLRLTAARYFLGRARKVHDEGNLLEGRRLFEKAEGAFKGIDRDYTDEDRRRWCPDRLAS